VQSSISEDGGEVYMSLLLSDGLLRYPWGFQADKFG
jgi:hypothetical protein